jgi:hypothetical protein
MNIWEEFKVEDGKFYFRQIGPLQLWIQRQFDEWKVGWDYKSRDINSISAEVLDKIKETDITWHRKVVRKNPDTARLIPVMPDRPVVVKPEAELKIAKNAEAIFFIRIPMWLTLCTGTNYSDILYEIPSVVLSNTWFGEPNEGELCYSMKTFARRSLEGVEPRVHQVICPIHVKNTADDYLIFKRLCIQGSHLGIYQSDNETWTNKIHVQFRGEDTESAIKFEDAPPKTGKKVMMIGQPRKRVTKGFARKSFDTFKQLANGM